MSQVREAIIKSSETIEDLKVTAKSMRPLAGIGGTAIGGYEALPQPMAPYLPEAKDPNGYTLVLDLDETCNPCPKLTKDTSGLHLIPK